jgi:23S rRNA (guanosine2251-2'-O)-methyltransferase
MIVYGKQVITYLLERHSALIKKVFLSKEIDKQLFSIIMKKNIPIQRLDEKKAQGLSRGNNHQGILAELDEYEPAAITDFKNFTRILVLCGITDMGNIGAIIRSSHALGIDGLIISGLNQVNWQGAVKTSSGAIFDLPVAVVKNVFDLHNDLKTSGFITLGATLKGGDVPAGCAKKKVALFLGSESEGLPGRLVKKLDGEVTIRMYHDFDSLNVSNAAAILIDRITHERF